MANPPRPIVLWSMERRATAVIDDAGISIKKFVLSPPLPAPRHIDASRTVIYGTVPPLAFFCIKALAPYADQLHVLDSLRVPYKGDVVDILCPSDGAPPDPRIWAAIAQTMHALPERLRDLDLPLSDNYLPLLQQIPSTPHFSLLTNLALPHCKEVSDDTVGELRRLNTLSALDLRGTRVSSYGLTALSRGLSQDDADVHRKTGPWGLRVLSLHSCTNVTDKALPVLQKFPLLSVLDLRFTKCTRAAVKKHLGTLGFLPSHRKGLFHPATLSASLDLLESINSGSSLPVTLYSCPPQSVFRIHVNKLFPVASRDSLRDLSSRSRVDCNVASRTVSSAHLDIHDSRAHSPLNTDPLSVPPSFSSTLSFYGTTGEGKSTCVRSLQHLLSSDEGPDPLAVTREPPTWNALETLGTHSVIHSTARKKQPGFGSPSDLAQLCRERFNKRSATAVNDMVNLLANKRLKKESAYTPTRDSKTVSTRPRNPFAKPVFSEGHHNEKVSEAPPPRLDFQEQTTGVASCSDRSINVLPLDGSRSASRNRNLKPITTLTVPVLPKEYLPRPARVSPATKVKAPLKQSRLSFPGA